MGGFVFAGICVGWKKEEGLIFIWFKCRMYFEENLGAYSELVG